MKRLSFTLKRKMVVSYLLILLVPSFVIGILSYMSAQGEIENRLMDEAMQSSKIADRIVTQNIQSKVDDIAYILEQPYLKSAQNNLKYQGYELKGQIKQYLAMHKEVKDVIVGVDNGEYIHATDQALPGDYDVSKQDWYIRAIKQSNGPTISPVVKSADGKMAAFISQMLPSGKGVIAIELNLDTIRSLTDMKLGKQGYILIVDTAKNYVVHPDYTGQKAEGEFVEPLFASSEGSFEYNFENRVKQMAFTTNTLTGWKVAGTMYQSEVSDAVSGIRNTVIIVVMVSILAALAIIYFIIRSIIGPINGLMKATERISQGDLREKLNTSQKDEIGNLGRNFQAMVDNIRSIILSVQEITEHVNTSAKGLSTGADQTTKAIESVTESIQEVAAGSEQQLRSVEQGMESMEAMSQEAEHISGHMQEVALTMERTSESAEEGNAAVVSVADKIQGIHETVDNLGDIVDSLNERTAEIGNIVSLITGIAQQTHLLALNASIEAARAGEHGRGFAVVAIEVRKLSEESEKSALRIDELVSGMQAEMNRVVATMANAKVKVTEGIDAVDLTDRSFSRIREAVKGASADIENAAASTRELALRGESAKHSIEHIRRISEEAAGNTQSVSASAQEQFASIEEIAASAANLTRLAEQLQKLVEQFKI